MADIKYYDVILKPVITEKSMNAMGDKKYTFMVHVDANKSMIKEAVEKMFPGTKVASVNTQNLDGKNKRRGMIVGKTAKTKKAIVKLTADSKEIETVDVPFNDAHAFEVKAANVNALKITLTPLDQKQEVPVYTQSTTGVIFNVKAE